MDKHPTPAPSANSASKTSPSRREFIRRGSLLVAGGAIGGAMAGNLSLARAAHPYGSDEIKIGLIGCGGRGTGAVDQLFESTGGGIKLVAMADAFENSIVGSYRGLKGSKDGKHAAKLDVPKERQFVGFDAYKHVLESNCDIVVLATPPGFRPQHFEAAIAAGKHVFMEKPVAVDPAGVRRVLKVNEEAKKKGLAVAVGLQRHHEPRYIETIKRIQEGIIGDIILARAYWNQQTPWVRPRQPQQTEMEYQMRNWYYFNWLCGDHIVEQHIHNLDVINWVMNGYPVEAQGQGGCQVRKGKDYGETFDHHFVEFTYEKGAKLLSQCRHIVNTWNSVSEHVHGTKGWADISGAKIFDSSGKKIYDFGPGGGDGHQQEQLDLVADLRAGRIPNEGENGAKSTMTAIFGRMATYSGQKLSWDEALNAEYVVSPTDKFTSFSDTPPTLPDESGMYKQPLPGVTDVLKGGTL